MLKQSLYLLLLLFIVSVQQSCKTQPSTAKIGISDTLELPAGQRVLFLDTERAGDYVTQDADDQFFERVRPLEMSIQMKRNYPVGTPREEILADYRKFLREDMEAFTESEIKIMKSVMRRAYDLCNAIDPDIYPKQMRLAKTKANHYGESVYYTREDGIVIPYNVLAPGDENELLDVMLHEIFHIWSRYHPAKRQELYGLIGFEPIGVPVERLTMDSTLSSRILFNPDGIDFSWKITLERDGRSFPAVPIITANEARYTDKKPPFFAYLQFGLYELESRRGGMVLHEIKSNPDGSPTLNLAEHPEFFQQIKDNTDYIIHPDEIMADNFKFLAIGQVNEQTIQSLSPAGQQLIKDMEAILKR